MAIHTAVAAAFAFSPTPMHLCYVPQNPPFDLGRDLYNNTKRGRLADSLSRVFVSSKQPRVLFHASVGLDGSIYVSRRNAPTSHCSKVRRGGNRTRSMGAGESNLRVSFLGGVSMDRTTFSRRNRSNM
jgi:hypothetical protein